MGRLQAYEMFRLNSNLDQVLTWHLQSNHYPPIPTSMVPPCKRAIAKANRGDYNSRVRLPKGITYKGSTLAPVLAMIEQHHLDSFITGGEY
jgi:hypothetical protein